MVDSDENHFIVFKNTKTSDDMVWKLLENMRNLIQNSLLKCTVLYSSFNSATRVQSVHVQDLRAVELNFRYASGGNLRL